MPGNREKRKNILLCLTAMVIVFLPKALMIIHMYPVRTVSDEIATVSGAAYAAGYDWSAVISHAGFYGQGFYILFWWVFRLTDNPIKIEHTILYCCAALQSLTVPIVFHIARKHFHIRSRITIFLLSVLAGYFTVNRILIMYNENFLNLYVWIVAAVLLEAVDVGNWFGTFPARDEREQQTERPVNSRKTGNFNKKKAAWSLLLCLLLGWSVTIHLRMLVLIIAFVAAGVLYCLQDAVWRRQVRKKTGAEGQTSQWKIWWRETLCDAALLIPLAIVYLGGRAFARIMQNAIWVPAAGTRLRNTSTAVEVSVDWKNLTYVRTILGVVFGQMNTYQVFSCGLGLLGILLLLAMLRTIRRHSGRYVIETDQCGLPPCDGEAIHAGKDAESLMYKKLFLTGWMLLLSVLGTIGAQAINWGNGIYGKMSAGIIDGVYNYKGFTYVRYFGIYAGALTILGLLCGFRMAEQEGDFPAGKTKGGRIRGRGKVLLLDGLILAFLQVIWFAIPQRYLAYNWDAREVFITFAQWYRGKEFRFSPYLYGIAFLAAFFLLTVVLCHWRRYNTLIALAIAVLMAEYYYPAVYFDYADSQTQYDRIDDSWRYLSGRKDEVLRAQIPSERTDPETGDLIQDPVGENSMDSTPIPVVYCCDLTGDQDHNSWYLLQFYLPRWKVIPVDPEDVITSGIVQANRDDYDPTGDTGIPCKRITLDEVHGEYIYLVGEEVISLFAES